MKIPISRRTAAWGYCTVAMAGSTILAIWANNFGPLIGGIVATGLILFRVEAMKYGPR